MCLSKRRRLPRENLHEIADTHHAVRLPLHHVLAQAALAVVAAVLAQGLQRLVLGASKRK